MLSLIYAFVYSCVAQLKQEFSEPKIFVAWLVQTNICIFLHKHYQGFTIQFIFSVVFFLHG